MSELEQNLSTNALMLVVETLAAKELYDSTRITEDFEFLTEKLKALESYIAELEEQVWNLNLENERMEEAYWIDETISPDGTLKPSVRKLLARLEKAETDLRLSDDLVKALDNRIAELKADNAEFRQLIRDWSIVLDQGDKFQLSHVESVRQAMLEINKERFIVHGEIEWQDDKSPNDTQTQTIVYGKEREE